MRRLHEVKETLVKDWSEIRERNTPLLSAFTARSSSDSFLDGDSAARTNYQHWPLLRWYDLTHEG